MVDTVGLVKRSHSKEQLPQVCPYTIDLPRGA